MTSAIPDTELEGEVLYIEQGLGERQRSDQYCAYLGRRVIIQAGQVLLEPSCSFNRDRDSQQAIEQAHRRELAVPSIML